MSNHDRAQEGERLTIRPSTEPAPDSIGGSGRTAPPPGLLLVTSDTGLCGTYNGRVVELAERFLAESPSAVTVAIGRKGVRALARRGIRRAKEVMGWGGRTDAQRVQELLEWLKQRYLEGAVSGWSVAYTRFLSALSWKPTVEVLLPVERLPAGSRAQGARSSRPLPGLPEKVIVEPDRPRFLEHLLRRYLRACISRILLEAFTAEHSARMMAMKNATENAEEMIETLTRVRNKVRQAAITKELMEVVSGAEALK